MADNLISREDAANDLLACAAYLADQIGGSDDRAEAITAVVKQYLQRGKVDDAAAFADTVDDPFVRDRLLIMVAQKCSELDDDEYALQLAEAIEEESMQSMAREAIAISKAQKGDIDTAKQIAVSVFHPDQILAGIALKQAEAGSDEEALATIDEIDYAGSATVALLSIAAMRIEKEDHESAVSFLEEAVNAAADIEHDEEKLRALIDTGSLFVSAKRADKAIETLELAREEAEAIDNVHRDSLLAGVAQGFMHAGSIDLADRALDAVSDKTQIATALLSFSRDYWTRGEKEEALEALDESYEVLRSQHEKETRDSRVKFALFGSIAAQYAGFENSERAIKIAEEIEDDENSASALARVAQILTSQGNDATAQIALNAIKTDDNRVSAIIGMSAAAYRKGDKANALALLDKAYEEAENIPQLSTRASAYSEAAERYAELEEPENARAAATRTLDEIAQVRDESSQSTAIAELAGLYARSGFELTPDEKEILRTLVTPKVVTG